MPKNYKVVKQKLKSTSGEFFIYRFLSMKCRSAYNTALANIKKHYKEENKEYTFSSKRIKRGLYKTKDKKYINADINGALNIYRKSSVCDMEVISNLIRRGVSTPKRLQII